MLDVKYFINGVECNPSNHKELAIEVNFDRDNDSPTPSLSTNKWTFVNKDAKVLNDKINEGLNGGAGIYDGVPFDIVLSDGVKSKSFNQYLDLSADDTQISCDEIEVGSVDLANIDWLNTKADSISFQYLQEQTSLLPRSKAVAIPYVINSIPNYRDAMIASVSLFVMEQALEGIIADITATIVATGGVFNSAGEVLRFTAQVAYAITLLIAVVKLIKDLIDLIIQPVKYHAGMYVLDQVRAACTHLGLEFKSTIWESEPWNRSVILPEKYENPKMDSNDKLLGFDIFKRDVQNGYFNGTFGDLLRAMKKIHKSKIVFEGNTMRIEKRNYVSSNSPAYTIPDIYQPKFTTNAGKIISNYYLKFSLDFNEKNTIQEYAGTSLQAITRPKILGNPKLNLIKNFERVDIPFALAKRKTELTGVEKTIKTFLAVVNVLIGGLVIITNAFLKIAVGIVNAVNGLIVVLNAIPGINIKKINTSNLKPVPQTSLQSIINDRIGMLLLETDVVSVPKIFILKRGEKDRQNSIDPINDSYYNARYLWDNFHSVISHLPTLYSQNGNQWQQKEIQDVPFTFNDLFKVLNNVPIFDVNGNEARVINLKWNPWTQLATINYEINKKYTDNLTLTLHDGIGY